jgi:hypothetical protein
MGFNALILQSGIELVKSKETGEILTLNQRWVYLKEGYDAYSALSEQFV